MSHECDGKGCGSTPTECYCDQCIEDIKQQAYDDGFGEGKKEGFAEAKEQQGL
jgi:hypothetical protein